MFLVLLTCPICSVKLHPTASLGNPFFLIKNMLQKPQNLPLPKQCYLWYWAVSWHAGSIGWSALEFNVCFSLSKSKVSRPIMSSQIRRFRMGPWLVPAGRSPLPCSWVPIPPHTSPLCLQQSLLSCAGEKHRVNLRSEHLKVIKSQSLGQGGKQLVGIPLLRSHVISCCLKTELLDWG